MRIGQIYRMKRPYSSSSSILDGLENFFYVTNSPNEKLVTLERGINTIAKVSAPDGDRIPAILVSSSPHKRGASESPWEDLYEPDNGYIRYYGDNKVREKSVKAEESPGNKLLLKQFEKYIAQDFEKRSQAVPIIFFERVPYDNRVKGNIKFQGFGIIESYRKVTQKDIRKNVYFTNYIFNFIVFSLKDEEEFFNWDWITDRRNSLFNSKETLRNAPSSWIKFLKYGINSLATVRRRVSTLQVIKPKEQKLKIGSYEAKVLTDIYNYYTLKKHYFEGLAARVTESIMDQNNTGKYFTGWITGSTNDGGGDFVGRLDIGTEISMVKIVVLGQAKCEKIDTPTNGNHIARTVARLKRGWFGVYVTTSYFSSNVQMEIIEDQYPIMLINGATLAKEVIKMAFEKGVSIEEFLTEVDREYENLITNKRPDEIIYE